MKVDYKKDDKQYYGVKQKPEIIDIPRFPFLCIEGAGNPNEPAFEAVVEALYSVSYAIKMSYKSNQPIEGYYEYTVYPLEGIWDLQIPELGIVDKSNFKYIMMIRQPDFVNADLVEVYKEAAYKKTKNERIKDLTFEILEEGLVCQMLHMGSYDDEPATFKIMEDYCQAQGYERSSHIHREIYLSDPRRTVEEKRKTILRCKVKRAS